MGLLDLVFVGGQGGFIVSIQANGRKNVSFVKAVGNAFASYSLKDGASFERK